MFEKFIIGIVSIPENEIKFLTRDEFSDYWQDDPFRAIKFNSIKELKEYLKRPEFIKPDKMSDGHFDPPRYIHSGLRLWNNKRSGNGFIKICKIDLSSIQDIKVSANLPCNENDRFFDMYQLELFN